jgi:hypothetical protein
MPSNDFAPRPPHPPSLVSKLSLFLRLPVFRRSSLRKGEGGGGGAKSYDGEKVWASINHSVLSEAVPIPLAAFFTHVIELKNI